jgi:hypothetical protein
MAASARTPIYIRLLALATGLIILFGFDLLGRLIGPR